jgi:hypothetical protein
MPTRTGSAASSRRVRRSRCDIKECWKGFWRWYWFHLKRAFWPCGYDWLDPLKAKTWKEFWWAEWDRLRSPLYCILMNKVWFVLIMLILIGVHFLLKLK